MTDQLIRRHASEQKVIATGIGANAKIRPQYTDECIQVCRAEVPANSKSCELWIGDDELTCVVTIDLRHDVRKRIAIENQHLVLPGESAGNAAFRQICERYAITAGECSLSSTQAEHRCRHGG